MITIQVRQVETGRWGFRVIMLDRVVKISMPQYDSKESALRQAYEWLDSSKARAQKEDDRWVTIREVQP